MKVLLATGGAGFIGSNFVKYFLSRNKNFLVVNIDKLSRNGNISNLRELEDSPRYHFIKGDICNYELVNYVLKKYRPDFIINFASEAQRKAVSETDRFFERPTLYAETNIMGTLTLLEGIRYIWSKRALKGNRFIQVSTDEVYNGISQGNSRNDDQDYVLEESNLTPESSYSASKAAADIMVNTFSKCYDIPAIITRCCSNYGPYQGIGNFVPMCISNALDDKPIQITGGDHDKREWIHVQDNCIALIRAMFYGRPGEIYNLGSGETASRKEIASRILKYMNKPEDLIDSKDHDRAEARQLILNSYKARAHLNWSSKLKLEEGLKDTIQWYKTNRNWWFD